MQFSKFHTSFPKKRKSQEIYSKHPPLKKLQLDSDTVLKRTRNDWGGACSRRQLFARFPIIRVPQQPPFPGKNTTQHPQFMQQKIHGFFKFFFLDLHIFNARKKIPKIFSTWAVKGDRKLRCPTKRGFGSSRSISGRSSPVAFRET